MTKEEITALISSFVNLVLTVIKFILAVYTGSIALLAEAWHSLSDIFSSFMVFAAIRADRAGSISKETLAKSQEIYRDTGSIFKNEESHKEEKSLVARRFFVRLEEKVAVGIGIFLIFASYKIFMKIIRPETIAVRNPIPAAFIILILALFSYLLFKFEVYVGEKSKSPGLIADGYHSKIDMFASMLVAVALVSEHIGFRIDKIAAVLICAAILIHAIHVLTRALKAYIRPQKKVYMKDTQQHEDILVIFVKEKLPLLMNRLYGTLSKKLYLNAENHNQNKKVLNRIIVVIVLVIIAGIYFSSGIYMLRPNEKAIVERFGEPLNITKPVLSGLHYALPLPIDKINKVDTDGIRRISVGYKSSKDYPLILWTNVHYKEELSFLTGENSFLGLTMNVHYKIKDIYAFLYKNSSPESLMEELANTILTNALAKRAFFSTITVDREKLEWQVRKDLQIKLDEFKTGIGIVGVYLRDIHPPTDIAPAFEDVVSAQEDYEMYINKAKGYENKVIPNARAGKAKMKNEAVAYRNNMLKKSEGEAKRFLKQQVAYRKHPDVTETRLYIEGMEEILPDVQKFIICPKKGEKIPDIWFFQGDQREISTIIREEK
ncbi:FtsH protease activity modulator HflK [bacterium]|nr:FtsH protease activity modulator HflK [bacterium]